MTIPSPPRVRSREARLVSLLLRREQRSRVLPVAFAVIPAAAAALGWHLKSRGLAQVARLPDPEVLGASTYLLASLGRALAVPFAMVTIYLVADRIASDHEQGWLAPLASAGVRRSVYPPAVLGAVLLVLAPLAAFATIAYAAGLNAADGGAAVRAATLGAIGTLPGQMALLVSFGTYALACATIVRRRGAALVLVLAGLVVPVMFLSSAERLTGSRPPRWVARAVSVHLPRPTIANTPRAIGEHGTYTLVVLTLISAAASRLVARNR